MKASIAIRTEKLKRIYYIKAELKRSILKSLILNNNTKNVNRLYANISLRSLPKRTAIAKQHKVCLLTGRQRGAYNKFNLSRHTLKKLGLENRLQNIKTQS